MPISSSRRNILPPIKSKIESSRSFPIKNTNHADLSKIYKCVLSIINDIEKQVLDFGDLLMHKPRSSSENVEKFLGFLEAQTANEEIRSPNHLLDVLERNSDLPHMMKSEFYDLKALGKKMQSIQKIIHKIPLKMDYIFLHNLLPYCVSCIDKVGEKEIPPITREYEEIINKNLTEIEKLAEKAKLNPISKNSDISIRKYLNIQEQVNSHVVQFGEIYLQICSIVKNWIEFDSQYPEKLQETILWLRNRRLMCSNRIKALKKHQFELKTRIIDMEKSINLKSNRISQTNIDAIHYTQQDKNVIAATNKIKQDILEMNCIRNTHVIEKQQCIEHNMIRYHNEQINTYNALIKKAKKRLSHMTSILNDLTQKQSECLDSGHKISHNLESEKESCEKFILESKNIEDEIVEIARKIAEINEQIIIIHHIISEKLNKYAFYPTTSCSLNHLNIPQVTNDINQIDEFFKTAAPVIGSKWKDVYKKLNFDPPRDWKQIEMDLEGIDINNKRLEPDFTKLAYLSLQKWKRLSRQATIKNLIHVLKKLNLAKYVSSQYTSKDIFGNEQK